MSKWQSGDIPIFLTMLALFLSFFSDKIEKFTSIPENIILIISCLIVFIPIFYWISGRLKHRNNK